MFKAQEIVALFLFVLFCFSGISPWPADCFSTDLKCADNAQGLLFALQGQWMRVPPCDPLLYLRHPTCLNVVSSDTAVWRISHQYVNLGTHNSVLNMEEITRAPTPSFMYMGLQDMDGKTQGLEPPGLSLGSATRGLRLWTSPPLHTSAPAPEG